MEEIATLLEVDLEAGTVETVTLVGDSAAVVVSEAVAEVMETVTLPLHLRIVGVILILVEVVVGLEVVMEVVDITRRLLTHLVNTPTILSHYEVVVHKTFFDMKKFYGVLDAMLHTSF